MTGYRSIAARWGLVVARRRGYVLGLWIVGVAVGAAFVPGTSAQLSPAGFETSTEATRAAALIHQEFPARLSPVLFAVFTSSATVTDAAYASELNAYRDRLEGLAAAHSAQVAGPVVSKDGHTAALLVESGATADQFINLARQMQSIRAAGPAQVLVGGGGAVYDAFISDSEKDLAQSEKVSLPLALLLLLVVFGGVVAASLPVATGLATVTAAVALLGLLGRLHEVSVFALNITSVVGIGLGIDYSLLVVSRFREELRRGADPAQAVATTMATAGVSTLVSGGTVAIGFGSLTLSRLNVLWSIGIGGALVVALSVLASLTLIPALLAIFAGRVDRLTLPLVRSQAGSGFWGALASRVMRRPVLFMLGAVLVIAAFVYPARSLAVGVVGAESLPPGNPAARAESLAISRLGFPKRTPVVLIASGVNSLSEASRLEAQIRSAAGGQPVFGPEEAGAQLPMYFRPGYAVYQVTQPAPDNSVATHRYLDRLRALRPPAGVKILLGGEAAGYQDFLAALASDVPRILAAVFALTFVLLGAALRSVVLPLKAVFMNLLSVGAAMGSLTWGFQEGHLSGLLNFQPVGFVDATSPVLIFAALFGLSMDYEVFLLTRIREEWLGGRSNTEAVAAGMERTGRIITSAALILVVVASTLALSHLAINKGLGVTIAIAVLLDATLIRLILVPALMRILGDANWWPQRRPGPRAAPRAP